LLARRSARDDHPIVCLQLVFLLITRLHTWLRLSRREEWWKTAEMLILRHQCAVLPQRESRRLELNWAGRALAAALLGAVPGARCHGLRLVVAPDTIEGWHRDIIRHRGAARSVRGTTGRRPAGTSGPRPEVLVWPR
jgi:putative transposase